MHNKCNVLESSPNHPPTPGPWKNCLPRNRSLVPKRLGTAVVKGLEFRVPQSDGLSTGRCIPKAAANSPTHPGSLGASFPSPKPRPPASDQPVPPRLLSLPSALPRDLLPAIHFPHTLSPMNLNCNNLEPQTKSLNILTTESHKLLAQLLGKWWA